MKLKLRKRDQAQEPAAAGEATPLTLVIGFQSGVGQKDVVAYAKGWADRYFQAKERSWWAVRKWRDGFFYELHEGGPGRSYLPDVVARLDADPDAELHIPVGERLFVVSAKPKPVGLLLTEAESDRVRPTAQMAEAGPGMRPLNDSGLGVLMLGASIAFAGSVAAGVGGYLAAMAYWYDPPAAAMPVADLPHKQWAFANTPPTGDDYVAALRYDGGKWSLHWASGLVTQKAPDPAPQKGPKK